MRDLARAKRQELTKRTDGTMKPPPITLSGNVPTITDLDHEAIADEQSLTAQETIEWMFDQFGQDHYIACSFQKTSSVTAHLASTVNPDARFFYLDTDVLFPETYEDAGPARRGARDRVRPLPQPDDRGAGGGVRRGALEARAGRLLRTRKVEPMRRALSSVDCWVAGVRRADSSSRARAPSSPGTRNSASGS